MTDVPLAAFSLPAKIQFVAQPDWSWTASFVAWTVTDQTKSNFCEMDWHAPPGGSFKSHCTVWTEADPTGTLGWRQCGRSALNIGFAEESDLHQIRPQSKRSYWPLWLFSFVFFFDLRIDGPIELEQSCLFYSNDLLCQSERPWRTCRHIRPQPIRTSWDTTTRTTWRRRAGNKLFSGEFSGLSHFFLNG